MRYVPDVHVVPWCPCQVVLANGMVTTSEGPIGRMLELEEVMQGEHADRRITKLLLAASRATAIIKNMIGEENDQHRELRP